MSVLDLSEPETPRVVQTISTDIGPTPFDVDLVPGRDLALLTNLNVIFDPISIGPGSISLVDLGATAPDIVVVPVGTAPIRAAVSSSGRMALVGNGLDQTISVIDLDTGTVSSTVELSSSAGPADVAIQP